MALTLSPTNRLAPASAVCFLIGLATALTTFWDGMFGLPRWGPVTLGVLLLLVALALVRPVAPRGLAALAIGGLAGVWAISLLSVAWAESSDQAQTEAGRWLLYTAFLAALLPLLRDRAQAIALIAGVGAGCLTVAGYQLARLLAGSGEGLFLGDRLHEPLGYANGQANLMMLGLWPLLALAEHGGARLHRALGLSGATLLVCVALMSGTRTVIPLIALVGLGLIALLPGRIRRAWLLVGLAACVAGAVPFVTGFSAPPADGELRGAVLAALLAGALAGGGLALIESLLAPRPEIAERARSASPKLFAGFAALLVAGAIVAVGNPVERVDREWREFKASASPEASGGNRLLQSGGARYDYWRVALNDFADAPAGGRGAGNWSLSWYQERRTGDDTRQPHSIVFQTLAEIGLLGALFLALAAGAVVAALVRRRREAESFAVLIGAGGLFATWLLHTAVDWMHVIPGITLVALCGAGAALAPWRGHSGSGRRVSRIAVPALALLAAVAGFLTVGRLTLAEKKVTDGQELLTGNPDAAKKRADQALDLNGDSLPAYFLRSAASARQNDFEGATRALLAATRKEPHNFVPWQLLGDLAIRRVIDNRYDEDGARRYYSRAYELNPRDVEIRDLARFPTLGNPAYR